MVSTVKSWLEAPGVEPSHICLATRSHQELNSRYKPLLEREGITVVELQKDTPESELPPGVRIGTMHRMKGLEFPRVLLASYTDSSIGNATNFSDQASREDYEQRERSLAYVAATRARDVLAVCDYG